jgi:hypothetical protein
MLQIMYIVKQLLLLVRDVWLHSTLKDMLAAKE